MALKPLENDKNEFSLLQHNTQKSFDTPFDGN